MSDEECRADCNRSTPIARRETALVVESLRPSRASVLGFCVRCLMMCLVCSFGFRRASAAPPNVTALFPSGCQVGQTVEVAAQGAVGDKPQAWVSRDGLKIEFAESGNKFKVIAAADAAPGLYWIRVFNAEGASPLRPFVVGTLPEVAEKEPNHSASEAQKLESSQVVVNGVLDKIKTELTRPLRTALIPPPKKPEPRAATPAAGME